MIYPAMIYLASASPRRQQLLHQLGVHFEVIVPNVAEEARLDESPREYVERLACAKARAGAAMMRARGLRTLPVLGADTEVVLAGEILGKPRNRAHGISMLHRLSGRTHEVLTAIAVLHQDALNRSIVESRVTLASLSNDEIERYWDSGEPLDKAGAYAVQGRAAAFIERIEGSYSGIVGLPLFELSRLLERVGGKSTGA
jgi:septum formation protein